MPDHLPGRSKHVGAGRPLTPAEFRKRELERKALEVWIETQSYTKVKNALRLRSNDVAREMVRRGEERWMDEEATFLPRFKKMVRDDLLTMRRLLHESLVTDEGMVRLEVIDRLVKTNERMAKLLDLDERKDEGGAGTQITVVTGLPGVLLNGQVIEIPPGDVEDVEPSS